MGKTIKGFQLGNDDKLHRAIHGTPGKNGQEHGGLIEKYGSEDRIPDEELMAVYDKLGGLVTLDGVKIETGSFWDIKGKKPRAKAEVTRLFRDLRGRIVKLKEGEEKPIEVVAAEKLAAEDREIAKKKLLDLDTKRKGKEVKDKNKGKVDYEEEEEVLVDVGPQEEVE